MLKLEPKNLTKLFMLLLAFIAFTPSHSQAASGKCTLYGKEGSSANKFHKQIDKLSQAQCIAKGKTIANGQSHTVTVYAYHAPSKKLWKAKGKLGKCTMYAKKKGSSKNIFHEKNNKVHVKKCYKKAQEKSKNYSNSFTIFAISEVTGELRKYKGSK